jgi:hypothetical protein
LDGYRIDKSSYYREYKGILALNHTKEANIMGVPAWVWVVSAITIFIVCYIAIWTTNKAYSRKWEEPDEIPNHEKKH